MLPRWTKLWALLCVVLVIQLASAESFRVVRRDTTDAQASKSIASSSQSKAVEKTAATSNNDETATKTAKVTGKETKTADSKTALVTTFTTTATSGTSLTIATSTVLLDNSTLINSTIPDGQLPLTPEITPGWGVAGVIMLLTGVAHTLVGIKNRAIHTFFSTAYVAALGVTVLIIYVMNTPVSDALQGGYVVAVVISGCAIGAAAMFFRELTEGLGCALGGFCLAMWLLCLKDGGLLSTVAAKAIFIACFTLAGFGFYLSRFTRDWALIILIAFSGATITVLGIDCFSRAGLKEFWAWVWHLNNKLFPLGADTYPVTKGIRVETAATIIIFLIGIVSQIKLWNIVREQREQKAAELAEGQRNLQAEEENVGRNIEETNARDRRRWERVYGEGDAGSSTASPRSDNGDMPVEKRFRSSNGGSSQERASTEVIEMTDMPDDQQRQSMAPGLMSADASRDGKMTIRVAVDDVPHSPMLEEVNEKPGHASSDGNTLVPGFDDRRISQRSSISQARGPEIVPLPFTIPIADDATSEAERSSVATFADEDDEIPPASGHRRSIAQRLSRLSHGSTEMLRRLSRASLGENADEMEPGESTEELIVPRHPHDPDDGSIAATVDDGSVSGDENRRSLPSGEASKSIEITATLSDRGLMSPVPSDAARLQEAEVKSTANLSKAEHSEEVSSEHQPAKTKSATSGVSSPVSLTKERLPRSLSRVAMSYRTNEWAKHLAQAEAPEHEELHIEEAPRQVAAVEKAAPVYMDELRKSADQGTPAPAIARSDSQVSSMSNAFSGSRRSSKQHVPANLAIPENVAPEVNRSPNGTPPSGSFGSLPRTSSSGLLRRTSAGAFEPIAEERPTATAEPIPEEGYVSRRQSTSPGPAEGERRTPVPGVVSYASPQTLIGQREMFLRNKSQGNLLATSPSDLNLNRTSSEAGSLYNYPMYAAAIGADADEIPLSQRKQLMRNSSLNALNGPSASSTSLIPRMSSTMDLNNPEPAFDSHQPKRVSTLPTPLARENALAHFRQSVQAELRSGTPVLATSGRETPFAPTALLGGGGREAEVQRNIDMTRNILMGQKEAEAQQREIRMREKEWADRAFDERMRSGDLLEAHREAMRRMQKNAREK